MRRKFVKMQGAGNDYIYFDCLREPLEGAEALAVRLSDRHKGIGGDGIVLICPSAGADARMRMFNADGSEGNMCGNAIRCVAKYLFDAGIARKEELTIETRSGIKRLRILPRGENGAFRVRVDMGPAVFEAARIPVRTEAAEFVRGKVEAGGRTFEATCVSMGNPHCVVFEDPDGLDLSHIGPLFESHPLFPERINTEFVKKTGERSLKMRVWERGSGETMACGTGACAAVAAAVRLGVFPAGEDVRVQLRGGELTICVQDTVFMTGEAETVFTGEVEL